jgi:hypothetical protein
MKLHFRADEANGYHTTITVFANGANCGQLRMTESEAIYFHLLVTMSTYSKPGEVISSGKWIKDEINQ